MQIICPLMALFFITSCAAKKPVVVPIVAEYDSLKQCRKAAKEEVWAKVKYAVTDEDSQNLIVYSWEKIIDVHFENVDTNCKYDPSSHKWKYDLSGSIEVHYRYKHGILDMPGHWTYMAMWTGASRTEKIDINDIPYQRISVD